MQALDKELLENGKELNAFKNRLNTRKQHGIKKFHYITIVAKRPDKIDTQHPVTLQLIKDMTAAQGGIFIIGRNCTSLYII